MLENTPTQSTMTELLGQPLFAVWQELCSAIDEKYDMERIIHNLMEYCHITEKEFQERVKIENDIEPLYFPYYTYVKSHPINIWNHKTFILRGENDTLCEYDYVKTFADNFGCELTEQKGGEHWFHTDFELDFFRNWIRERLY